MWSFQSSKGSSLFPLKLKYVNYLNAWLLLSLYLRVVIRDDLSLLKHHFCFIVLTLLKCSSYWMISHRLSGFIRGVCVCGGGYFIHLYIFTIAQRYSLPSNLLCSPPCLITTAVCPPEYPQISLLCSCLSLLLCNSLKLTRAICVTFNLKLSIGAWWAQL